MKPPHSLDCEAQGEPRMNKTPLANLINQSDPDTLAKVRALLNDQ